MKRKYRFWQSRQYPTIWWVESSFLGILWTPEVLCDSEQECREAIARLKQPLKVEVIE